MRPPISEEDVLDRSKGDILAKFIAASQILQLVLSLLVRRWEGLDFSQLEAVTLSFAICDVVTYAFYLCKPKGVGRPISLRGGPDRWKYPESGKTYERFWNIITDKDTRTREATRAPNDIIPLSESGSGKMAHPGIWVLAILSGAIGAIHAVAWNFAFPTAIESVVWRAATIMATCSPLVRLLATTRGPGDPKEFMRNCITVLNELSWHMPDFEASYARERLEAIYSNSTFHGSPQPRTVFYEEILRPNLSTKMLEFMKRSDNSSFQHLPSFDMPGVSKKFVEDFEFLTNLVDAGGKRSWQLRESAKTNIYPRRSIFPKWVNFAILVMTAALYCLARLTLLALAFSSLRLMPKSVYTTTSWTSWIPSLGSST
jgi:hypothetical protein